MKRYSSGMYVRLAFAVAAHLEPEILIVDEVLAVGDAAFQQKCLGKMGEVARRGPDRPVRQPQHVGHHLARRPLPVARRGPDPYERRPDRRRLRVPDRAHASAQPGFADLADPALRLGVPKQTQKEIVFESARLLDGEGHTTGVFFEHEPLRLVLGLRSHIQAKRLEVLCRFNTLETTPVFTLTSGELVADVIPGHFELAVDIRSLPLRRGSYQIDLYVLTALPQDDLRGAIEFEVAGPSGPVGDARQARDALGVVFVEQEWGPLRRLEEISGA